MGETRGPSRPTARPRSRVILKARSVRAAAFNSIVPSMITIRRATVAIAFGLSIAACAEKTPDDGYVRGPGLRVAGTLPAAARAVIYDAAVREAFDVGPGLSLLLGANFLPRTPGLDGGAPVPKDVADALRQRGVIRGVCASLPGTERGAPVCDAPEPGYIVRFSEIFRMSADSVQVHVAAERYNTPTSAALELMRFEKAYQLVGSGMSWRVVRAGRVTLAGDGRALTSSR